MKIFFALIIGIVIGVAGLWLYNSKEGRARMQTAGDQIQSAAKSAKDAVQEKLKHFDIRTNDIKDELAHTGQVVRRTASDAGKAIADATVDARTTAAIKGKLLASHELSAFSISVNTTGGIVTLSGTVPTEDAISKAMLLALETDGVNEVISTLQVKPKNQKS